MGSPALALNSPPRRRPRTPEGSAPDRPPPTRAPAATPARGRRRRPALLRGAVTNRCAGSPAPLAGPPAGIAEQQAKPRRGASARCDSVPTVGSTRRRVTSAAAAGSSPLPPVGRRGRCPAAAGRDPKWPPGRPRPPIRSPYGEDLRHRDRRRPVEDEAEAAFGVVVYHTPHCGGRRVEDLRHGDQQQGACSSASESVIARSYRPGPRVSESSQGAAPPRLAAALDCCWPGRPPASCRLECRSSGLAPPTFRTLRRITRSWMAAPRRDADVGGRDYRIAPLAAAPAPGAAARLPYSLRILLENLLRRQASRE